MLINVHLNCPNPILYDIRLIYILYNQVGGAGTGGKLYVNPAIVNHWPLDSTYTKLSDDCMAYIQVSNIFEYSGKCSKPQYLTTLQTAQCS